MTKNKENSGSPKSSCSTHRLLTKTKSKFTEIFIKLKEMLDDADIPFRFEHEGEINTPEEHYLIIISSEKKDKRILCDACQASHSIGHQMDLIEICGGLTAEESNQGPVLGYVSAADAFKRFKYCYKNNTHIYFIKMASKEALNELFVFDF